MKRDSPWLEKINRGITVAESEGMISQLFDKHVPDRCPPVKAANKVNSLTLRDLGGVFLLAAIATAVSIIWKIFYMAYCRRKSSAKLAIGPALLEVQAVPSEGGSPLDTDSGVALVSYSNVTSPTSLPLPDMFPSRFVAQPE